MARRAGPSIGARGRAAPAAWRDAWRARDAALDGVFFAGASTGRTYCRSTCSGARGEPTRTVFFRSAAEAEAAGRRPCRRCRPECAPGLPWCPDAPDLSRALALGRDADALAGTSAALASRVGTPARRLGEECQRRYGASLEEVWALRSQHFARLLQDGTVLSDPEIALAVAGATEAPPAGRARLTSAGVQLPLGFRHPMDWDWILAFLGPRATPGVEEIAGDAYRRSFVLGRRVGVLEVRPARPGQLALRVVGVRPVDLRPVYERVAWMLDLSAEPGIIEASLGRDPQLRRAIRARRGIRVPRGWAPFELGVRAILGQQVTVRGATTLAGRLVASFGRRLPRAVGAVDRLFPSADRLAEAPIERIGIPAARARALRAWSAAALSGALPREGAAAREVLDRLEAIPGVGPWTAQYVAMRGFGEPDVCPVGDLGLRRALGDVSAAEVARRAERWRPWRSYATMLVWSGYS